jgi:hypothetical protein
VRCNSSARGFYARDASGRLVNPVGGEASAVDRPRVPLAFLPFLDELYALPFPHPDDESVGPGPAAKKVWECVAFGDFLAAHGDCERAATEYSRATFIALSDSLGAGGPSGTGRQPMWVGHDAPEGDLARFERENELLRWSRLKTAACYYRNDLWAEAVPQFLEVFRVESVTEGGRSLAGVMAAASLFNEGQYEKCRRHIEEWRVIQHAVVGSSGDSTAAPLKGIDGRDIEYAAGTVSALCDMGCGKWDDASRTIETMARADRLSVGAAPDGIGVLSSIAHRGLALPRKNATLASVLSALVPGSGQVYAGRAGDGLRHFILDGLLIYGVSKLARDEEYWGAYLVAGIAIPFYAGNVTGARAAAENFNRRKVAAFLNSELRELEAH